MELSAKQKQFNAAMQIYSSSRRYQILGPVVSIIVISLQACLLYTIQPFSRGFGWQVPALVAAYLLTDFINGLVHMYMDNTDRYDGVAGPLIANFHLHHKTPQYKKHNLLVVYFTESGSKLWLIFYLLAVLSLQAMFELHPVVSSVLVYTGVLSSLAEVSHYLCHSSTSAVAGCLADCGLLLSKRHHARHHLQDNSHYAFLNGCTDPFLNRIAALFCPGYKQRSDLHYAAYVSADGECR